MSRFNLMASVNNTSHYYYDLAIFGVEIFCSCVMLLVLFLMIFVYKTFKTTLQRLILYYVILGLWFVFSYSLRIKLSIQEDWACIVATKLRFSAVIICCTYIFIITNLSLLLVPCLLRGRPVSKRSIKYVECICVVLTVFTALVQMVTFVKVAENDVADKCTNPTVYYTKHFGAMLIFQTIYMGIILEVSLVSLFLSIFFYFIRRRINSQQIALSLSLRNLIYHFGINTFAMAAYSIGAAYNIAHDYVIYVNGYDVNLWEDSSMSPVLMGTFVLIHALFCMCTSTQRNVCCAKTCKMCQRQGYAAIDGNDVEIATNPKSTRVSQPSYTNFAPPYTGGFTQITASDHDELKSDRARGLTETINI